MEQGLRSGVPAGAAGIAALDEGDFAGAIDLLRQAVDEQPADAALRRALGEALAASGDIAGAGAVLDEALIAAPADVPLLLDLAHLRLLGGDSAAAQAAIGRAVALAPADPAVRLAEARIAEASGDLGAAVGAYGEVARLAPSPPVLNALALLALASGRYREADSAFRLLALHDPDAAVLAQHGRIWCQIRRGDWRNALELSLGAARSDRYELTTALLIYARDRLFSRLPADEIAAREAALAARVLAELHDHAELYGAETLGTGEGGERD